MEQELSAGKVVSIEQSQEYQRLPTKILVPLVLVISLAMLTGIVGNLLVIMSYFRDRKLQNTYNTYLLNLAACDLCLVCISMTVYLIYTIKMFVWPFGRLACKLWLSEDYVASLVSVLLVVLAAWDRVIMVRSGVRYSVLETRRKAHVKVAACWAWATLLNVPPLWLWDVIYGYSVNTDTCDAGYVKNVAFNVAMIFLQFVIPLILLVVFSLKLFFAIQSRKSAIREKRRSNDTSVLSTTEGRQSVNIGYSFPPLPSPVCEEGASTVPTHVRTEITVMETSAVSDFKSSAKTAISDEVDVQEERRPSQESAPKSDSAPQEFTFKPLDVLELRGTERKGILKGGSSSGKEMPPPEMETDRADQIVPRPECFDTKMSSEGHRLTKETDRAAVQIIPSPERSDTRISSAGHRPTQQSDTGYDSMRRQLSRMRARLNRVAFTEQRHRQAAMKLSLLVLVLVVCWLPYSIAIVMYAACETDCVDNTAFEVLVWLLWIRSCINPYLYAYGSPRFRQNFRQLLGSVCPCMSKTDRRISHLGSG